jgi:outer membrane receptor protein involved in Fe transport
VRRNFWHRCRKPHHAEPEPPGTPVPPLTAVPTTWFSQLTYRVGIDHEFANGTLVYASKNLGFKSGGYNSSEPSLPNFAPKKLNAYEVGFKSEFFDRNVRCNGAACYYKYTNIQMVKLTADNQRSCRRARSSLLFVAWGPAANSARVTAEMADPSGSNFESITS